MISLNIIRTIKLVQASFPRGCCQTVPFALKKHSRGFATNDIIINGRRKREELENTEFDHRFSIWKPLTGPNDWFKHGAERYRNQNLQKYTGLPGVYELAAAPVVNDGGFISRILVPLYLGVTENLKVRLQQHGRNGAHLENGSSGCNPPWLFSGTFSRGCLIIFRGANMNSKEEARELEGDLLGKYDFAWNAKRNGRRRPEDVYKRIDRIAKESAVLLGDVGLNNG